MSPELKVLLQGIEILVGAVPGGGVVATAIRLIEAAVERGDDPDLVIKDVLAKYSKTAQDIASDWK